MVNSPCSRIHPMFGVHCAFAGPKHRVYSYATTPHHRKRTLSLNLLKKRGQPSGFRHKNCPTHVPRELDPPFVEPNTELVLLRGPRELRAFFVHCFKKRSGAAPGF